MAAAVARVAGRDGTDGTVVSVVVIDGWAVMVDVTVGVVIVVDVGKVVAADEGLRSQGLGGDACMSKDSGRRKDR